MTVKEEPKKRSIRRNKDYGEKPSDMNSIIEMSAVEHKKLLDKYSALSEKIKKMYETIARIRSNGDTADLEELNSMLRQAKEIENILARAKVVEVSLENEIVNIGDTVLLNLTFPDDEPFEDEYTIVGYDGCSMQNCISIKSDLGKAVIEQPVGSVVFYNIHDDETQKVRVDILEKRRKENLARTLEKKEEV